MATQYYTATSLDGFIADADHSLDWLLQFDEGDESGYPAFIQQVGAIVMGANTYRWILAHQVNAAENPQPWPYRQPCWILTHSDLPPIEGADLRFASGDVSTIHPELAAAAADKNIWLVGGGDLAGQFHDHGLLDEVILSVAPVFLGSGAPLLPRRVAMPPLELVGSRVVGSVFAELRYRVPHGSPGDR